MGHIQSTTLLLSRSSSLLFLSYFLCLICFIDHETNASEIGEEEEDVHSPVSAHWAYAEDQGTVPELWGDLYPECNGEQQSPIDIQDSEAVYEEFEELEFTHTFEVDVDFANNQHTTTVVVSSPEDHTLSGGPLDNPYLLEQFHFHWGENATAGSEHLVDGGSHPLVAHFVHFDGTFEDLGSASESGNAEAFAVVAIFFEVGARNDQLIPLVDAYPHSSDVASVLEEFDFDSFFAELASHDFYTYHGSLTTPPCSEQVRWIVMKDVLEVSHEQLDIFRGALFDVADPIGLNHRPVQPLGDRVVKKSWIDTPEEPDVLPGVCHEECTLNVGQYWSDLADSVDVDSQKVSICCGTFYYDSQWTCVGSGSYAEFCNGDYVFCPSCTEDTHKFGTGTCQVEALAEAVESHDGIHPMCPSGGTVVVESASPSLLPKMNFLIGLLACILGLALY